MRQGGEEACEDRIVDNDISRAAGIGLPHDSDVPLSRRRIAVGEQNDIAKTAGDEARYCQSPEEDALPFTGIEQPDQQRRNAKLGKEERFHGRGKSSDVHDQGTTCGVLVEEG